MKKSQNQKPQLTISLLAASGLVLHSLGAIAAGDVNMVSYREYSQNYTSAYFRHLSGQNQVPNQIPNNGNNQQNANEIHDLNVANANLNSQINDLKSQLNNVGPATPNLSQADRDGIIRNRVQIFQSKNEIGKILTQIRLYTSNEELSNRDFFGPMKNGDRFDIRDAQDENGWGGFRDRSGLRLDRRIQELRQDLREAQNDAQQAENRVAEIQNSIEYRNLVSAFEQSERKFESIKNSLRQAESELNSLNNDKTNIQAEITKLQNQVTNSAARLSTLQAQKPTAQAAYDKAQADQKAFHFKAENGALIKEEAQLRARYDVLKKRLDSILPQLDNADRPKIQTESNEVSAKILANTKAKADLRKKQEALDDALDDTKNALKKIDSELNPLLETKERLAATQSRAANLPALLEAAKKSVTNYQSQVGSAKTEVDTDLNRVRQFDNSRIKPLRDRVEDARKVSEQKATVLQRTLELQREINGHLDRIQSCRDDITRIWNQALINQANGSTQAILNQIAALEAQITANKARISQLQQQVGGGGGGGQVDNNGGTYKSVKDWENYLLSLLKFRIND